MTRRNRTSRPPGSGPPSARNVRLGDVSYGVFVDAPGILPARALELGVVNAVLPAAELDAEATRWAEKIAGNAPLAISAMKRLFRHGLSEDFEAHSHHVLMQLMTLFRAEDFKEAMVAYLERRPAKFTGR